jgi:hypothetical protein
MTVTQRVKNLPAMYGSQRFNFAFTRDHRWDLVESQMNAVNPHFISLRLILILQSHLLLGLPSGLFPSDSLIKMLYEFIIFLMPSPFQKCIEYVNILHTCFKILVLNRRKFVT